ncbi:hypothetical protein H0H87_005884 [Tephrocybe sp. NHM501043]|nr:hypothetical protein H0H87_005884 [Tephrocybe sp. NHM501043]
MEPQYPNTPPPPYPGPNLLRPFASPPSFKEVEAMSEFENTVFDEECDPLDLSPLMPVTSAITRVPAAPLVPPTIPVSPSSATFNRARVPNTSNDNRDLEEEHRARIIRLRYVIPLFISIVRSALARETTAVQPSVPAAAGPTPTSNTVADCTKR